MKALHLLLTMSAAERVKKPNFMMAMCVKWPSIVCVQSVCIKIADNGIMNRRSSFKERRLCMYDTPSNFELHVFGEQWARARPQSQNWVVDIIPNILFELCFRVFWVSVPRHEVFWQDWKEISHITSTKPSSKTRRHTTT
jgi:hypothetical protein